PAFAVGLAQTQRATQQRAVEPAVVDLELDRRASRRGDAEGVATGAVSDRQRAVLGLTQKRQNESSTQRPGHRSTARSRELRACSRRARPSSGAPLGLGK